MAGLNRLAQTDLLDRLGLRKQTERPSSRSPAAGSARRPRAGRTFASAGTRGEGGRPRPGAAPARGVFDLTPTEDEQLLVDVVTEFATEVVRPAAADADDGLRRAP